MRGHVGELRNAFVLQTIVVVRLAPKLACWQANRMRWPHRRYLATALIAAAALIARPSLAPAQTPAPPVASQNPSPMVEETRVHERFTPKELGGVTRSFVGPAGKHVEVFVPDC